MSHWSLINVIVVAISDFIVNLSQETRVAASIGSRRITAHYVGDTLFTATFRNKHEGNTVFMHVSVSMLENNMTIDSLMS